MNSVTSLTAQYGIIASVVIAFVVWLRLPNQQKWDFAVMGIIGGLIALLFLELGGKVYYDPRPFVVQHIAPLFSHAADNGFPSDHTLLATFLAVCVLWYSRSWGMVLIVVAVVIGAARVAAHIHHPIDIAAAMAFALVAALIARPIALWLTRRWTPGLAAAGDKER